MAKRNYEENKGNLIQRQVDILNTLDDILIELKKLNEK